jgi:anti-anti-sigma factor
VQHTTEHEPRFIEDPNSVKRANVVWRPIGPIDISRAIELRRLIAAATPSSVDFTIDLRHADFIDYAGARLMVNAMRRIRAFGGTCSFVNPYGQVLRVLKLIGLYLPSVQNGHATPPDPVPSHDLFDHIISDNRALQLIY